MANSEEAINKTLVHEGYYSNNAKDRGGETYCGISRRNFPDWEGWSAIDKFKSEYGLPRFNQQIPQADKFVDDFYVRSFWNPLKGGEIKSQAVANVIFDTAVNCGVRFAVLVAQEVARDCFGHIDLTLDGKIGPNTLLAINNCSDSEKIWFSQKIPGTYLFLTQYTALRMRRYARLAKEGDSWAIVHWTHRAFSYLGSK